MDPRTVPVFFAIAIAAMATAALIHQYVPSYEAFVFRRMLAWLSVKRAFTRLRHLFDRDARRLDRYAAAMIDLETALEFRDGLERRMADDLGADGASAIRGTATYAMLEAHLDRRRARAAKYLASMPDEDIVRVAGMYRRGILEGKVAQEAVEAFFRDERELVRATPAMVTGHFSRMEHRFNRLHAQALAREAGNV